RTQVPVLHPIKGIKIFDSILQNATVAAEGLLKVVATRHLQPQFMIILIGLLGALLLIVPLLSELQLQDVSAIDPFFAVLWIIGGACAVAAAWSAKYHRLAALLLIGGTGLATSVTFLMLSAPDLALTQLMVETVTTVLILLGLRWLPPRIVPRQLNLQAPRCVWLRRSRDLAIAVASGLAMTAISYAVLVRPQTPSIADFFLLRAKTEGGGSNVVNVLLVDFRAFDTFGEITVLAIVALTVYALLRRFRPAPESVVAPPQQTNRIDPAARQTPAQQADSGYLMIPAVYLRFLLPFMGMITVYFFLRGHNLPGGGFVAGLLFSVAMIVQYMLAGTVWVESRLRLQPHRWIAWGLATACLTGLGAWLLGYPFFTSHA